MRVNKNLLVPVGYHGSDQNIPQAWVRSNSQRLKSERCTTRPVMTTAIGDEAQDVEDSDSDREQELLPTDYWDDGAECRDNEGILQLWCALCGNRPRRALSFRCRLHDEMLSNGLSRPVAPLPLTDGAAETMTTAQWVSTMEAQDEAMAAYKEALDHWAPEWVAVENLREIAPTVEQYPLPCVRCSGPMVLGGVRTIRLDISCEELRETTPWLPKGYGEGVGQVNTSTGQHGTCVRCQLVMRITPESEE